MYSLLTRAFVILTSALALAHLVHGPGEDPLLEDRLAVLEHRLDTFTAPVEPVLGGRLTPSPLGARVAPSPLGARVAPSHTGPSRGPIDAPVTIVEFIDMECPYCDRVQDTLDEVRRLYPDEVRIVFKHRPLPFHKQAEPAAFALACADEQGLFWELEREIFSSGAGGFVQLAHRVGVDGRKFSACMASERPGAVVRADIHEAIAVDASGTPTFFVNGEKLVGAQPLSAFTQQIDLALLASRGPE